MGAWMDRLGIEIVLASEHAAVLEGLGTGLSRMREVFAESGGRIRCLAVFDPRSPRVCLEEIRSAADWEGLAGIKIHPSSHGTAADDRSYGPIWELAAELDLAILTHSWSVSDYNPSQALSTPGRFEGWIKAFPSVKLVLGHAGGRGTGRHEATRLACAYENVFLDFAGDIYCYRLIETLAESVPVEKILFGSDFPWTGASDHLTRVLLGRISDKDKARILCQNAAKVYKLKVRTC
jgi:predicted TIM-barrel fold metal-dependent hydrolase